jgi:hypothetical protein
MKRSTLRVSRYFFLRKELFSRNDQVSSISDLKGETTYFTAGALD